MYRDRLNIPENHQFILVGPHGSFSAHRARKTYCYDEIDESGNVVFSYVIREKSQPLPLPATVYYSKFDADKNMVGSGTIEA